MVLPSIHKHIAKEAERSDMRHRLGAVIVKNGKYITSACNKRRHSASLRPEWVNRPETICAERLIRRRLGVQLC